MVTLRPHPHSRQGDTSVLLDLELKTGNIPIDGFAVELLFHSEVVEIADVYLSDTFEMDRSLVTKEIDNKHGHLLVTCTNDNPCVVGGDGRVIATLCVRTREFGATRFEVGERTQLYIHG